MTRFVVHVVPRASRSGPSGTYDGVPRLRVKAPPADGKANAEAEAVLSKLLGARVRLSGGGRSRRKTFEIDLPRPTLDGRLRKVFG